MAFNAAGLLRFIWLWLGSAFSLSRRWSARRLSILVAFFLVFPILELANWSGLALDNLLSPRYRHVEIRRPVFVAGYFRSGTTFLHRLLALDGERFCTMQMWEILFAPSITQRRIVQALAALEGRLGGLFRRRLNHIEAGWREQNPMHRVSLTAPEEDEYLLLHIWEALTIWLSSGLLEGARPYAYFDDALPEGRRRRIMAFYARSVQRHLHAAGAAGKHYLAKNPALTPKLASLLRRFPDATVVCLVRSPLEAIASFQSMMEFSYRVIGNPLEGTELRDFLLDMAHHWYGYPLEGLPPDLAKCVLFVNYDDLVADPEREVTRIYDYCGFEMTPSYAQVLRQEALKARSYRSRHEFSLEDSGFSREQIVLDFQEVLTRFGFDTDG